MLNVDQDITNYLQSKNIPYKLEGLEAIITCLECGKEKLYINIVSGAYQCFVCTAENPTSSFAKGHISHLKEVLGDIVPIKSVSDRIEPRRNRKETDFSQMVTRYAMDILDNREALKYLFQRGITSETVAKFAIGVTRRYDQNWLSIPSFEDGIPKLIKFRKLPPDENATLDKYIREKGSKSILFNGDALKHHNTIHICEGEIDAITLLQAGYENVIGITGGAGTLLPEWYEELILKEKLILILDNDAAGQTAAKDVWATRLGLSKCYNVLLPEGEDVNSFFLNHTKEDFDKLILEAKQFKVEGIVSLQDSYYKMYEHGQNKESSEKYALPWPSVNRLLSGGLSRQRLTIVGGSPGSGKTTFALQICYYFAIKYKIPSLFFCLEMPEISLAAKVAQLHFDLAYEELDSSNALIYAMELENIPIYFGYSSKIKPDTFYNTMVEVRNRYGVQLGVFDNIQRMIRSGEEADMGKASGMFKDITMDLNVMFILISQPRKMNSEEEPTFDSLKGSSSLAQDADEIILLHRKRLKGEGETASLSPTTKIIVDKGRFSSGGRCKLNFLGAKSRLDEFPIET